MPQLLNRLDGPLGCYASVLMDVGDVVYIKVAVTGVSVENSPRFGFSSVPLYESKTLDEATTTAQALRFLYRDDWTKGEINNPVLKAFTNAVLRCSSLEEVTNVLQTAVSKVGDYGFRPQQA